MDCEFEDQTHDSIVRVLLVDMSPINRKLTKTLLERDGYVVSEAAKGEEALEILAREYHHVLITGMVLDDMTGSDLCARARAASSHRYTYIIVLSSKGTIKDITHAIERGADEFMNKPIMKPLLMARLTLARRIIDLEAKLKLVKMQSHDLLMKDALTEVYNRRRIQSDLPSEIKRAGRYKSPLSLVICDLDHFKSVNDTHGHLAGDQILKEVAQRLKRTCRQDIDWVARYGGEEFVIVLPETEVEGAMILAENMRAAIEETPFRISDTLELNLTMSFGAAGYSLVPERGMSPDEILGQADLCLYKAKAQGRNRVCYQRCLAPSDLHGQN